MVTGPEEGCLAFNVCLTLFQPHSLSHKRYHLPENLCLSTRFETMYAWEQGDIFVNFVKAMIKTTSNHTKPNQKKTKTKKPQTKPNQSL